MISPCAEQTATITNHTTKVTSNVTVWLRGRAILDAVITDLLTVRGMQTATSVVVGGCSAGGMAVYAASASLFPSLRWNGLTPPALAQIPEL